MCGEVLLGAQSGTGGMYTFELLFWLFYVPLKHQKHLNPHLVEKCSVGQIWTDEYHSSRRTFTSSELSRFSSCPSSTSSFPSHHQLFHLSPSFQHFQTLKTRSASHPSLAHQYCAIRDYVMHRDQQSLIKCGVRPQRETMQMSKGLCAMQG